MTTQTFVGPDGKAYAEHKPEEGGFLSYFDGCMWLITFPVKNSLAQSCYFFLGDRLPCSAKQWQMKMISSNNAYPAHIES